MGGGKSPVGGGGGKTPSGVTYKQFMQMSEDEQGEVIDKILTSNITVPKYLDSSDLQKVKYALGMTDRPQTMDDDALDNYKGKNNLEFYRTVNGNSVITGDDICDQIMNGDTTQYSDKGGSLHGRAIYFATNFGDSVVYSNWSSESKIMRAKMSPNAKGITERKLNNLTNAEMAKGSKLGKALNKAHPDDASSIFALSKGIHYYSSDSYTMVVDRSQMVFSKTVKTALNYGSNWKTY